jgi:hypothetical protein
MNWPDGTHRSEHNAFDLSEPSDFGRQWVKELATSTRNRGAAFQVKEVKARQNISFDPHALLSAEKTQRIKKGTI